MKGVTNRQGMTKKQSHAAFDLIHSYAMKWTSHKQSCERLKSEMTGHPVLAACTCGYFDAQIALEKELSRIRKGEPPYGNS